MGRKPKAPQRYNVYKLHTTNSWIYLHNPISGEWRSLSVDSLPTIETVPPPSSDRWRAFIFRSTNDRMNERLKDGELNRLGQVEGTDGP